MTARPVAVAWLVSCGCGCGSPPPPTIEPATPDRIAIVGSERGPQGARLVAMDEHGDRQFVLVQPAAEVARDSHPAISPDGTWIVFASSRGRSLDATSLWIAPLAVLATPVRLTSGPAIDSHATWTSDGLAIVFSSTRDGGDFDLWKLAIAAGRPVGEPVQLTAGAGHEITPTVAADGTIIYAAVTPLVAPEIESHLEQRAPDGVIRRVTNGPADSSPALSPDGTTIAFARPRRRDGGADLELWQMTRGAERAAPIVDLPMTDDSGPVWSRDGRVVFATSVLRGEQGVMFSSIVHVDLREAPPRARMLEDRAGPVARLTPAIATSRLDMTALHGNPAYLAELARIMEAAFAAQRAR